MDKLDAERKCMYIIPKNVIYFLILSMFRGVWMERRSALAPRYLRVSKDELKRFVKENPYVKT